ncbi:cbiP protein [Pediococcus claussenii]|nr:cbiP protein [Pediococcus claussenii]
MFQGTASDSGKSWMVAAFCRYLTNQGNEVVPFKSQNMALNSYITPEGFEMGRAQVFQAEAARKIPNVRMNPVLLKPSTDSESQIIVDGKVIGDMKAKDYFQFKNRLRSFVQNDFDQLASENDVVLLEGAGSPAEINLNKNDFANMGMADMADAPVVLVADIDKGGVFASIYGTIKLLPVEHQKRIKGIIINKFRGDVSLLQNGNNQIEELTGVPVLGVMPMTDLDIDEEDSVALARKSQEKVPGKDLDIAVIVVPKISNYTDFNSFKQYKDVSVRYVRNVSQLGIPDLIIIPGSKNTNEDLSYLRKIGFVDAIKNAHSQGCKVFGICGGYQMLGKKLVDKQHIESQIEEQQGIGLLNVTTYYEDQKTTTQACAQKDGYQLTGYEIHMGKTILGSKVKPFSEIREVNGKKRSRNDGAVSSDLSVNGTYLHGVFDNALWTRHFLNNIRLSKGLEPIFEEVIPIQEYKSQQYDKLAKIFAKNVDVSSLLKILDESEK